MRTFVHVLILLPFLLLGFLTYSNTFDSPFHFDDQTNIEDNVHIRMTELNWHGILGIFKGKSWARPVPMLSFALNYYFGRYDIAGYHLVNVLIHVTSAILLYFFLTTTLGLLPTPLPHASWVAFFSALLWLVHPVQTQSVTYIVQRTNSMAALFYVLSLLLYVRGRIAQRQGAASEQGRGDRNTLKTPFPAPFLWFAGSALAGLLAVGSKETSVTLPFFVFLYEWYFLQDLSRAWLRRYLPWILCACVPMLVLVTIHLAIHHGILTNYRKFDFTMSQRVLTELRVVLYYLSLLFYPHPSRLNLDHDFPLSHSLIDPPTTLLSLGVIGGFVGLACWLAKKERLLSFSILWFFGNLVIESSFIPLDLLFEHRLYLPSMLLTLIVVAGLYRHVRPKPLTTGLLCAVTVVLCLWTYQRNVVWRDGLSLWADTVKKSPNKARPHNNLGEAFSDLGRLEEAIAHYREALRIKPDYGLAHNNLGVALAKQGKTEEAMAHLVYHRAPYEEVSGSEPKTAATYNDLGNELFKQGELDEAIVHYQEALRIQPDYPTAHNNLGIALSRQGNPKEAIVHYQEALRIEPGYTKAHYNLANVLLSVGRLEEAIDHYQEALRIQPDYAKAHHNLAKALLRQGNPEEAKAHYEEAVRILRSRSTNPDTNR